MVAINSNTSRKIVKWLREQVTSAKKKGALIALSGGIDSAVTAVLCKKAFPDKCLALILPCESNPQDQEDAIMLAEKFKIPYKIVDLNRVYLLFKYELNNPLKFALANIKPRLRMIASYYFAQKHDYLVIGTCNKSEIMVGYFTKYGDGGSDIEPIGDLFKTEIFSLARVLNIPDLIIKRIPTAGLWMGQTDESEMGITYRELDKVLDKIDQNKMGHGKMMNKVLPMVRSTEHKRHIPPVCKLR